MLSGHDELVVPASRTKLVAIIVGSASFVAAGGWLLERARTDGVVIAMVGAASVAFFGFCGAYAIRRIVRPEPALVIDREGIVDNASALGVGLIRWAEVAELREYKFKGQTFLGIFPKELEQVLARQPGWKRKAIQANIALGVAPVNIPQVILPIPVSDLMREIKQRDWQCPLGGDR